TLETSIAKYYGINLDADRNTEITTATDAVQRYFSCCGAYGGVNSTRSWYLYQNASAWYPGHTVLEGNKAPFVPLSCCKRRADSSVQDQPRCLWQRECHQRSAGESSAIGQAAMPLCLLKACFDAMQSSVSARILVAGAVGISYVVLMIPRNVKKIQQKFTFQET
uniref:Tetraspanin n=1 Tax=Macrostomum lignano TaxID=282301 RepID=A0A1I8JQ13_9PLAT